MIDAKKSCDKSIENHIIGIMDPNSFSFRAALEELFSHMNFAIPWRGKTHHLRTRRILCRPYNTLEAVSTCSAILNRGTHWNPHHNSFFSIVQDDTYLLNDTLSYKSVDANSAYGQIKRLGLRVPRTWAIPQEDYSDWYERRSFHLDLIFSEHELFDLAAIGDCVGYPAYLKPQGKGFGLAVKRVENTDELFQAYRELAKGPVNLQRAVEWEESIKTLGIGPQTYPMHYNPEAVFPHNRYLRSSDRAVDFFFLKEKECSEARRLCKIINALYNWDHNCCEILLDGQGNLWPIDFANAYPNTMLTSLHFYFPEVVKAMVKWLTFNAVNSRKKPEHYRSSWPRFREVYEKSKRDAWSYESLLIAYEELADEHFATAEFEDFCQRALGGFDERALEYFESEDFDEIILRKCQRYFEQEHEIPQMVEHYRGIHRFWCYCERERLGLL